MFAMIRDISDFYKDLMTLTLPSVLLYITVHSGNDLKYLKSHNDISLNSIYDTARWSVRKKYLI